jgi:succinyl-CoA synthetase alpha subunit
MRGYSIPVKWLSMDPVVAGVTPGGRGVGVERQNTVFDSVKIAVETTGANVS